MPPKWAPSKNPNAVKWQNDLDRYDGYVFVVAEYNHSISGALKNALDQAFNEWGRKPAAVVGYGGVGAARAVEPPKRDRPLIGMTSFGKTVLRYMVALKPALESRGFEVAVFHATGMGGRAFESLAEEGAFAAVLDFAPQELGNHIMGSSISAGATRMTGAGKSGTPQIVSIGCHDLVDFVEGWRGDHDYDVRKKLGLD